VSILQQELYFLVVVQTTMIKVDNNKRIHLILSILIEKGNCSYIDLYNQLIKIVQTTISHRNYNLYLKNLRKKRWINKQNNMKRQNYGKYSITELGRDCYRYKIVFEEYNNYEKSFYLLFFLMGVGVSYDSTKLNNEEIKDIQLRNNYYSISKKELRKNIMNNKGRIFGYVDFQHYSEEQFDSIFEFLMKKNILKYNNNEDRYYLINPLFQEFINKYWVILFQYTFRLMFDYVYSFVRGPQNDYDWLKTLFGEDYIKGWESYYNQKRSQRRNNLKMKDSNSFRHSTINGKNLLYIIKNLLDDLIIHKDCFERTYLRAVTDKESQFFIERLIKLLCPEFIVKEDFVKMLNIKSNKNY
jgi:hypothetical protein